MKDRKAGKAGSSSSGSKKGGSESKEKKKSKKTNDVIELNEANFNALVLESSDHWLVMALLRYCIGLFHIIR